MSYNPYKKYSTSWWRFWLNFPRDIIEFIKRVWDYSPLLWDDRDWDYSCILQLLRFKLLRLRKHMEKYAIIAHAEDVIAELACADVLLRNVIEEDPDDEWSNHYSQWHSHIKAFKDCKNRRKHMRALRLSGVREERNWKNLWQHIEKHCRGWWD